MRAEGFNQLSDYSLTEWANPWLRRYDDDMRYFADNDEEMRSLMDDAAGRSPLVMFDAQLAERFGAMNVSILRQRFFAVAVPPPGYEEEEDERFGAAEEAGLDPGVREPAQISGASASVSSHCQSPIYSNGCGPVYVVS